MSMPFLSSEEFDERAHLLYNAGEYEEALVVLREGLRLHPDAADLHVGIGYVRLAREEYVWARHAFARALELDYEHEDAWVGLGETLLKFGLTEEAIFCFDQVEALEVEDALELGLAVGRALYREGHFWESRERLSALAQSQPDSAEVQAALAYSLHALGDEPGARRALRTALRLDENFHEARIYLSHLLFERGDLRGALGQLDRVPPEEHWDPLSLWRTIELKCTLDGYGENDVRLQAWRARLAVLSTEPDTIDHLLAEVEAAFEGAPPSEDEPIVEARRPEPPRERSTRSSRSETVADPGVQVHRVRTAEGTVYSGTWEQIVLSMRDSLSDPNEPLGVFMRRAAQRFRSLTGRDLDFDDPETFVRESARAGLLRIEA